MKTIKTSLSTSRWLAEDNYKKDWHERSALLLTIAENIGIMNEINSYTEYGCGPFMPFKITLKNKGLQERVVYKSVDIKKWDDETIILDLNKNRVDLMAIEKTDCGIFSGVLEYLDDLPSLFFSPKEKHKILFVSYAIHQNSYFSLDDALSVLKNLSARANSGWRNHQTIENLISNFDNFGYIGGTGMWGNQALFVLINKNNLNE